MFNLIIKDIKNILYDRKTLAVILFMPIILMSILGGALQGIFSEDSTSSGVFTADVAIVKEYNYEEEYVKAQAKLKDFEALGLTLSQEDLEKANPEKIFFEDFLGDAVKESIHYTLVERAAGEKLLEDNAISALIILPKNYIFNSYMNMVSPGRNVVTIETIKNTENQFQADMVDMIMSGYVGQMSSIVAQKMVLMGQLNSSKLGASAQEGYQLMETKPSQQLKITSKEVTGEDAINSFQYYAVAIMTMFLLYAASIGGKALIEEKNEYTLQRLEVAGKLIKDIAISNFFRIIAIAILQTLIMIIFSFLVLKVEWGDTLTVAVAMLCSSFAVGSMGVFVSVITLVSDRYYIASVFEFGIVNLMALVGGSFIPVELLPNALQKINFIAINGSAIKIYMNGMGFRPMSESLQYILILLGMGLFFIICATIAVKTKKGGVIA